MTDRQEAHLRRIIAQFAVEVDAKYRKGAAEHGGDLQDSPKLKKIEMAIEEAIDLYVFLQSTREHMLEEMYGKVESVHS